MSSILNIIRGAKQSGDLSALAHAVPYARFLGIEIVHRDGEIIGQLTYDEPLIGNAMLPALHGGTIGALLESTAIFKVLWMSDTESLPKTINITIDYLRSAGPKDTFARGIIRRHGRRVANVFVEAWQDDPERPVATAHCHLLLGSAPSQTSSPTRAHSGDQQR